MSAVVESTLGTSTSSLAADQHRAESLLAELAAELRRVPVDEHTRTLHLRALSLKRAVMHWAEEQPDESIRRAVVHEVLVMQGEARDWRRVSLAGRRDAGEAERPDRE